MRRSVTVRFHAHENAEAAAEALADRVAEQLRRAVAERGRAGLVVSGGRTPLPFFHALRARPLDWGKVTVTLADERWVSPAHPDSNEKLAREHLLRPETPFVPLHNMAAEVETGAAETAKALASTPLPFDAVVLGMGEDGHVASLFPRHPALKAALDPEGAALCMAVNGAPQPPPRRITLTLAALLRSRRLYLHITGENKRNVVARAMKNNDPQTLPVSAVLHQTRAPLDIFWAP